MMQRFIQNGYFLLFTFVTGLFYFCFYLVTLTLGLSLSFTVVGIPLLTHVLRTTSIFVQYERVQTKIYTDITTPPYEGKLRTGSSFWEQAKAELLDHRNWTAIAWLMLKFLIGLLCLLSIAILYITPTLFILVPLLAHFFDIYFIGIRVDTFSKSLIIMSAGFILAFVSSWLANGWVRLIGGYTRQMIKILNR
ncbi:sensor domain-containing protein [Paenibacillus sp. N3.4]|uniref:sensor domain-containing protein n=1 Tax=Paenibacillus sp. N3.4 TaxID=2603222 RepID=UPI0011C8B22B|nr:sensor domain-containing protein [Paenibacillus sp. N3.4]TXK73209.1 luciferase [Paenibacillus sp. N3.4]